MLVCEYVAEKGLKEFYCYSDLDICVKTLRKGRRGKNVIEERVHSAINLCDGRVWEDYKSYDRFAYREIRKIDGNQIYTKWTMRELINELEDLTETTVIKVVWCVDRVSNKIILEQE